MAVTRVMVFMTLLFWVRMFMWREARVRPIYRHLQDARTTAYGAGDGFIAKYSTTSMTLTSATYIGVYPMIKLVASRPTPMVMVPVGIRKRWYRFY